MNSTNWAVWRGVASEHARGLSRAASCALALYALGGALPGRSGTLDAAAGRLVLTRDGKAQATIVVAKKPARAAWWAANDLQHHIQLITGVELPIKTDDVPASGCRILVGESRATRKLGLDASKLDKQEYLIRFLADTLVLVGIDDPRADSGLKPTVRTYGSPTWTDGRFGQALAFDGNDALDVTHFRFPDDEGTMEAWVWLSAEPTDTYGTILRIDGMGPWTYHIVQRQPKTRRIEYVTYPGNPKGTGRVASRELTEGWHHVLALHSVKTGKIELVVDGQSQGRSKYVSTTCEGCVLRIGGIGQPSGSVSNPYAGRIDEVRISDVARRPVTGRAAAPFGLDDHTRLLVHLDEGRGVPTAVGSAQPLSATPPPMFEDQATCYAVYDFLERFCSVRWLNPTDFGTDAPSTKTLVVQGRDVRRKPFFRFRQVHPAGLRYDYGTGLWYWDTDEYRRYEAAAYTCLHKRFPRKGQYNNAKRKRLAAFLCRLRAGGEASAVNHTFYGYYDRFWAKNPGNPKVFVGRKTNWFSRGHGHSGRPYQLCYTSPGLIRQVVQDARDYFDGKPVPMLPRFVTPGRDNFPLEPMDNSRYCECDRCRALWKPRETYAGWSCGTHSDYIFHFFNEVAKGLRKTHPDKHVAVLAYHSHAARPKHVTLEPNLIVHFCFACNRLFYDRLEYESELKLLEEWATREKGRPLYLWLYYTFPMEIAWGSKGGWYAFPGYFVHTLDRQFKRFHKYGVRGMFHCGYGQEVEAYVTCKLMDDPTLDVEVLLADYFARLYGPAAAPLRRFYDLIEQTYSNPANYPPEFFKKVHERLSPGHQTEQIAWEHLGTPKRMAELGALMAQAKALAQSEPHKTRVDLFEKRVWDYLVEGRRKSEENKPKRRRKQALRNKLRHLLPTDAEKKAFEPKREAMRRADPPTLRVPRVAHGGAPGTVDLGAVPWSKGVALSPWYTVDGYPTRRQIEGRLLHDGRALYVRLTETVDAAWLIGEPNIFSGDDWEVFVAAERTPPYDQIALNPDGKLYLNPSAARLRTHMRAVSKVHPDRWELFLVLPLDKMPAGPALGSGRSFYANFYRAVGTTGELLAWQPNFARRFHALERMGRFVLE